MEDEIEKAAIEYQRAKKAYQDFFHKTIILEQLREEELLKEEEWEIENKKEK